MTSPAQNNSEHATTSFDDLGLRPELVAQLHVLGYEEPTPIQAEAIVPLLEGKDLIGQAATGTGKTAAFALPALQLLGEGHRGSRPVALVLAPTRELAMQVSEATHKYGRPLGARVLPVYGGQPIVRQLRELQRGVDIVVATPGRAIDHLQRGTLRLDDIKIVVLDEADEMLDMGFAEDIEQILSAAPKNRQTVMFSATMPRAVEKIAQKHLREPVRIQIAREKVAPGEGPRVRQSAYIVARPNKPAALGRVLDVESPGAAIVFCRTREEVDTLTETLNGRGYRAEALHGGLTQGDRDKVMGRLRNQTADLLVATDVAARGLDVDHLTHVVNYSVPSAAEAYVHRIGRVGRAGREGVAITLAEPREHRMLKQIERLTGQRIAVETLPTVADLRARRMELTRASLREVLLAHEFENFRGVVEQLTDEFDVMDVALAAVQMAHEASGPDADEQELPTAPPPSAPSSRPERGRPDRQDRGSHDRSGPSQGGPSRPGRTRASNADTTRLFIGAGRVGGIRPQDLVGAIAGESSLSGRDIGAIEIAERFSLVEVPSARADEVIDALRGTLVKGRKVTVRREKFEH